ncbi:MAG: VTT domain-containing protein [Candidatus Verstraetearchaeota archaeon]|nr:VTT domain-containing protein [Candidatus Verstraetearchaeota archaeon]
MLSKKQITFRVKYDWRCIVLFENLESWLIQVATQYGYVGALTVSILGNLIPFIPIPYLAAIFYMAAYLPIDPIILGAVSGIGGAIGKTIIYIVSFGSGKLIGEEEEYRISRLRKLLDKYGALAVFIFTITPSPDDIIIIPLGLIRYNFTKFFIACLIGKCMLSIGVAVFGQKFIEYLNLLLGGSIWGTIISVIFLAIITVLLLKIDWIIVTDIVDREGWKGIIRRLRSGEWREFLVKKESK